MQKQDIFLKIKVHFVLYYKYYSYLCNTEKEIKDRITYHKSRFYFLLGWMFNLKYKIMEVLLNLQNKNVTLNAVDVAPEGTNCCNRLKVHFDVFQETAEKAAIIRLSAANSFELIHYQDKHIALLIPFDRIQRISY